MNAFQRIRRASFAAAASLGLAGVSEGVVLSGWTFETNTPADSFNSSSGPVVVAETGYFTTGYTLAGFHTSASSDWTTPSGNGSANSYSSNGWSFPGSYIEFTTSTLNCSGISLTFDLISSGNGPRDFRLNYGQTPDPFFGPMSVTPVTSQTWDTVTGLTTTSYLFEFFVESASIRVAGRPIVYFRLSQNSNISVDGGTVEAAGTSSIDNVMVHAAVIPEPSAFLLGCIGLSGMLRRRR